MIKNTDTSNWDFQELPSIKYIGNYLNFREWNFDHLSVNSEFLYINQGCISMHIHDKIYEGKTGDVFLIPKGTLHRDEVYENCQLDILLIEFNSPEAEPFFNFLFGVDYIHIVAENIPQEAKNIIGSLLPAVYSEEFEQLDYAIANHKFFLILLLIARTVQENKNIITEPDLNDCHSEAKIRSIIHDTRKFIDQNYYKKITLNDIADHIGVSSFYLSRVFSKVCDFSLFEYLNQIRMQKALELLKEGNMFIGDIAEAVGFSNSNYFTKAFKRFFGESPSKYHF